MLPDTLVTSAYIGAIILFILTLGGLSHQETSKRGNLYGMIGMSLAIVATILSSTVASNYLPLIGILIIVGGAIGMRLAIKVEMTHMPELVAILHSLVGLAAVLVGYINFMGETSAYPYQGVEKTIHEIEIYIGILIGAVTFSGSVMAFGKLSGRISSKPLMLPARHWINLGLLLLVIITGKLFLDFSHVDSTTLALIMLIIMTIIALLFGVHMVLAIGGADMPVVVSMLNSYSGWAASATGFMLQNDLLIVVGALVGSSGAILSYIMCRAMNRNFIAVIAGGFGTSGATVVHQDEGQSVNSIDAEEAAHMINEANKVVIIPGYGMAVAQAQHVVNDIAKVLKDKDIEICFAIHPVAGRMPGHMNVLLAEASIPYDIVFEMDEINHEFNNVDVSIVIGANDIVNPSAEETIDSPISGMPVITCWHGKITIVLKRSMATGYAGINNPLFYKDNTRMLFGDAKASLEGILSKLK